MGIVSDFLTAKKKLDPHISGLIQNGCPKLVVGNSNSVKKLPKPTEEELPELINKAPSQIKEDPEPTSSEKHPKTNGKVHNDSSQTRTIFVGNIPIEIYSNKGIKQLQREFSKFGEIESVRWRSVPRDPLVFPFKKAIVKRATAKGSYNLNAYIVYKQEQSVREALSHNGHEFMGHHLRVDLVVNSTINTRNSIFVGGLPFTINEEALYSLFEKFGEISYVRVPRDRQTKIGRGIAYVCFKKKKDASRALEINNTKYDGRDLRVFPSKKNSMKNTKQHIKKRRVSRVMVEGMRANALNKKVASKIVKMSKSNKKR